ncbi:MAG: ABC transporter substrate-binding protein [Acidimicrobiales bacterium]
MRAPTERTGRRVDRRGGTVAAALVLVLALVAGCASESGDSATASSVAPAIERAPTGPVQRGGELAVGLAAETNGWDPTQGQWSPSAYLVANAVFDPLVVFDEQAQPQPYLAQAVTPNADFTSWRIDLRPGVEFHDGTPLDGAAVARDLDLARTSGVTSLVLRDVTSVVADGPLAVRVTTSRPFSTLPLVLAGQPGYMASPAQLADKEGGSRHPVGTGPFRFVDWTPDQSLRVERNPRYWREGLPYLDGIDFRIITDGKTRVTALQSGQLGALEATTPDTILQVQKLASDGASQVYTDADRETDEIVITLNTSTAPFDRPTARQAVAAALDREAISAANGGAFPAAWGPLAPSSPAYLSPEESGYPPPDPNRARQLADTYQQEAGQPLRFSLQLPPDPSFSSAGQLVQAQLASAGIEMSLEPVEQTVLINNVLGGRYQASGFALFSTPTLDRAYPFVAGDVPPTGLSLNIARYTDPELTAAMDAARATADPAKQAEAYRTVQRRFAEDLQILFFAHRLRGIAYGNRVHGLRDTTVPGTDITAYAGVYTTPFFTAAWVEPGG